MNEFLTWLLDAVQSVDPVLRTILAGVAIMLETSVLVGLFVPGDTIVIIAGTAVASPLEGVMLDHRGRHRRTHRREHRLLAGTLPRAEDPALAPRPPHRR